MENYDIDVIPAEEYVLPQENETVENTETHEEISVDFEEMNKNMAQIAGDVRVVLTFIILTFCWSAVRAWRKNFTKGV